MTNIARTTIDDIALGANEKKSQILEPLKPTQIPHQLAPAAFISYQFQVVPEKRTPSIMIPPDEMHQIASNAIRILMQTGQHAALEKLLHDCDDVFIRMAIAEYLLNCEGYKEKQEIVDILYETVKSCLDSSPEDKIIEQFEKQTTDETIRWIENEESFFGHCKKHSYRVNEKDMVLLNSMLKK